MTRRAPISWVLILAAGLAGCGGTKLLPSPTTSQTSLTRANFRVLRGNVKGSDYGFKLFGFIPIVSPSYGDAMGQVRSAMPTSGRSTALANVTQDSSTIYLLLFSIPSVQVTADVIEFIPEGQADAATAPEAAPSVRDGALSAVQ